MNSITLPKVAISPKHLLPFISVPDINLPPWQKWWSTEDTAAFYGKVLDKAYDKAKEVFQNQTDEHADLAECVEQTIASMEDFILKQDVQTISFYIRIELLINQVAPSIEFSL